MNRGNFTAKDAFPVSTQTYDFIQQMAQLAGKLAQLGGANYILSGCVIDGEQVSSGLIVINGEILPFEAGKLSDRITIQEIKETDNAFGVDYPEAYIHRVAKFSPVGEYVWGDFVQVLTNQELKKKIDDLKGDAPGTVKMWAGLVSQIPKDYLICDGNELSIDAYPDLYKVLGVRFGGDGQLSFNLPDLRGRFIVGFDSANKDYNEIAQSKASGSATVTLTEDNLATHKHIMPWGENPNADWNPPWGYAEGYMETQRGSNGTDTDNAWAWSSPAGKNTPFDVRPPYMVLAYIIKVK